MKGTTADQVITDGIGAHDGSIPEQRYAILRSSKIPASAPTARKERRALVKALGARQFKKIYRGIKV